MISPTERAPVCSGGQLELMCTTTEDLEWGFNVFRENEITLPRVLRVIPSVAPSPSETSQLINSTVFYFTKTSAEGALPVMSRLLISPVSRDLNGTVISCEDLSTADVSSTTVIVRERDSLQGINTKPQFHACASN